MPTAVRPSLRAYFQDQLPKVHGFTFERGFHAVAGGASILGLAVPLLATSTAIQTRVYLASLSMLVALFVTHSVLQYRRKLHRFAQVTSHLHYINHIIRDYFLEIRRHDGGIDGITKDVLDAVAQCFSILAARRCRACVIELKSDLSLQVMARDRMSGAERNRGEEVPNLLRDNSDFEDLWYRRHGCMRYFLNNNLPLAFTQHRYRNSSFEVLGKPEVVRFLGFTWVRHWRLPYQSALVVPIRYLGDTVSEEPNPADYWGFLCIDCGSTRAFEERHLPELACALADALYMLYAQTVVTMDLITQPRAAVTLTPGSALARSR